MDELKNRLKSWLGKEPKEEAKNHPPPSSSQDRPQASPPSPAEPAFGISASLLAERDEARRKITELEEELSLARKTLETEFRRKSEERIRLFAQLAHSDSQAQALLEQEQSKFHRVQKEYESEIETLDATLKNETTRWNQ